MEKVKELFKNWSDEQLKTESCEIDRLHYHFAVTLNQADFYQNYRNDDKTTLRKIAYYACYMYKIQMRAELFRTKSPFPTDKIIIPNRT